MKKIVLFLLLLIPLKVNAVTDYYKDLIVNFNHDGCDGKEVTIQLFADGEKVEDGEVVLNENTGYSYTYEHLLIFNEHSPNEIKYEVKILENGTYRLLSEKRYTYETTHISKWVQVLPEDIKPGHTYVLTTDNWNVDNNGFSPIIYLRGDVSAKGANVVPDYNIINGKQSYYSIEGEPIENTKWTVSAVPSDDPNYEEFKDYLIFTNEAGKNLVMTGYNRNNSINYIWRASSKSGYVDSEDSMNTNKVTLTYVEDSKGRFYIGTKSLWPEPNNVMQYVTLSGQNQYQSGSNMSNAAQFKAYEYVDMDIQTGITVVLEDTICDTDTIVLNKNAIVKKNINVYLDSTGCNYDKEKGVTIQLFAEGKKVEDGEVHLSDQTGFEYIYRDLPVYQEISNKEIHYEVKALLNGEYYTLPEIYTSYRKENIQKWVQVMPEDIKPGHTYVITTDNLNAENNGFSKIVYLRGDVSAKGANVLQQYYIIDNKRSYYLLDGDPIENTKWELTSGNGENYFLLTNEEGKRLVLTGYNRSSGVRFQFKASSKNGYVDSEDATYSNNIKIEPTGDVLGTFYLLTNLDLAEPNNAIQYLYLNSNNQYNPTTDITRASKFKIYEYVDGEVYVGSDVMVEPTLCTVLGLASRENPNTGIKITLLIIIVSVSLLLMTYLLYLRKKKYFEKA